MNCDLEENAKAVDITLIINELNQFRRVADAISALHIYA